MICNIIKTRFNDIEVNIKAIVLSLYFTFVWIAYIYLNVTDDIVSIIILSLGIFAVAFFAIHFFIVWLGERSFAEIKTDRFNIIKKLIIFFGVMVVCFLVTMIWYIAFYPGCFSMDSINQYTQVAEGNYDDWHPFWHTFVFYWLPMKITGKAASIVLFQLICFSLLMSYMFLTIFEYIGLTQALISLAYILLNPYTISIFVYPWKDVAFAMAGTFCLISALRIYILRRRLRIFEWVLFGMMLASATLFRHNGLLFTLPLLVAMFFYSNKKDWIKIAITFALVLLLIKIPLYTAFDVEKPGNRVSETVGLPLTVIGNVVKETPELMPDDLSEYAYSIANQDEWSTLYKVGDFNSIKNTGKTDLSFVNEKGQLYALKMLFECFLCSPKSSFESLFYLTDLVYGFETSLKGVLAPGFTTDNDYGIVPKGNIQIATFIINYINMCNGSFLKYMRGYGIVLLCMFLAMTKMSVRNNWRKILLMLPIFIYDFGTMLLLTGLDSRFFYITIMVFPIIVLFSLHDIFPELKQDYLLKKSS